MDHFFETPASQHYNKQVPALVTEARGLFERALELHPDHFDTLLSLSLTYVFGGHDTTPGLEAIARARSIRPLNSYMLQIQASLMTRNGHLPEACAIIEQEIRPKDMERAIAATRLVGHAAMIVAMERLAADDSQGAAEILAAGVQHLQDPELTRSMREMLDVIASGGRVVIEGDGTSQGTEGAAPDPLEPAATEYNDAIELINAGRHDEALAILDKVVAGCVDDKMCAMARSHADNLRGVISHNRYVSKLNSAVDMANSGDRKGAVEILRELEASTEDPEQLRQVQEFLRSLGARVSKKKKN